ncbi:MAG: helicase-related protein, partial [Candidatus Thorarchaeota archaeon]
LEKLKRLMQTDLNNRKYIIFTQYKDTANYLYTAITEWARNEKGTLAYLHNNGSLRIDIVTGDTKNKEVKIRRFAPHSNDGDEYDIRNEIEVLISTDALAEGVNLQDADGVVNYDLPWNPMIIVQRIGRVNRIGNEKHIFVKNFLPADEIDTIIGILPRISTKIEDIILLIGKESYIISPDEEIKIETFGEKIKDISKATLSELEEMTSVGDAKIIGEIKNKHEVADMLLRNFVLHELGLRKEDFDEVKELDKDGYPIYTLTDSNEVFLLGEISRAGTKRKVILKLNSNGEVVETTSVVFKDLWNKKLAENVDLSEFYMKLEKLKAKLEDKAMEMRSLRVSSKGGYLTNWANQLNGYLFNQSLTGKKDDELLKMVEAVYSRLIVLDDALTSKVKGELRDKLLENKAIDNNNRIRDYRKFCQTVMEFLKFKKGVDLNIRKKVYGWWA